MKASFSNLIFLSTFTSFEFYDSATQKVEAKIEAPEKRNNAMTVTFWQYQNKLIEYYWLYPRVKINQFITALLHLNVFRIILCKSRRNVFNFGVMS